MKLLKKIRKNRNFILFFALLAVFYLTVGCPIRLLTGISCPGCGMTRALFALLRLDFSLAFDMHPLVFLLPFAVVVYFARRLIPKKILVCLCLFALALLLWVYIIRMNGQSEIVYCNFRDGLICRLFFKIKELITS